MSERGQNFLDRWIAKHLPNAMTDDPAAISDLADEAMKAAEREGISSREINDEVGSVFEVILEAMQRRVESHRGETDLLAARLAREAGVTGEQARELIKLIGNDWPSLLREAHFLKARH